MCKSLIILAVIMAVCLGWSADRAFAVNIKFEMPKEATGFMGTLVAEVADVRQPGDKWSPAGYIGVGQIKIIRFFYPSPISADDLTAAFKGKYANIAARDATVTFPKLKAGEWVIVDCYQNEGHFRSTKMGKVDPAQYGLDKRAPFVKKTFTFKDVNGVKIQADVYRSDDYTPEPVLLNIHGGATVVGGRQWIRADEKELCRIEGYCYVSMDYRLAPEVKLPQILEDLQDCIKWIHEKGPNLFQADAGRIVVVGISSGGYLALMAGFCTPQPTALISLSGYSSVGGPSWDAVITKEPKIAKADVEWAVSKGVQTNVLTGTRLGDARVKYLQYLSQNGLVMKELIGFDSTDQKNIDPLCPVLNVTSKYPPAMLVQGESDNLQQAQDMVDQLQKNKVPHELIKVPDAGNGQNDSAKKQVNEAYTRMWEFIKKYLKSK